MGAGAASLEAAQIVATQEETVDDFLTAAGKQIHVPGTATNLDTPIRVPQLAFQRDVVGTVHIAADETRVAAEAGVVGAKLNDISAMRDEFAVTIVERNDLTDLRQKRCPRLIEDERARARIRR